MRTTLFEVPARREKWKAVLKMKNQIENLLNSLSRVLLGGIVFSILTSGIQANHGQVSTIRDIDLQAPISANAEIQAVIDKDGIKTRINANNYHSDSKSGDLLFVLSASSEFQSSTPIQYFWELVKGDGMSIALSSGSGSKVTAQVSGKTPCVQAEYIVRMTAVDSSGMRGAESRDIEISLGPKTSFGTVVCRAKRENSQEIAQPMIAVMNFR